MKVSVDTNVLVRGVVRDHVAQANAADRALENASLIALTLPCLCEFVWVLRHVYKFSATATASALQALLDTGNVVVNRPAVEAGMTVLMAGGDFADGVIAFEGRWMGGEIFISFDKKAVALIEYNGHSARLLG